MTWLWITADDGWLFRDGRPFTAAENHTARSIFPPYPTTVRGALRGTILGQAMTTLGEYMDFHPDETPDDAPVQAIVQQIGHPRVAESGDFWLRGPFLAQREDGSFNRYLPVPADMLVNKAGNLMAQSISSERITEPTALSLLYANPDDVNEGQSKKLTGRWISESDVRRVLAGDKVSFEACLEAKDLYKKDNRLGIAIDTSTHTTRDQLLYRTEMIQPCPGVGLLVEVSDDIDFGPGGKMALGGMMRSASYTVVDEPQAFADRGTLETDRLKLITLTPAYFEKGFYSEDWSAIFGQTVELMAVALHKPQRIGGYDYLRNHPRTMWSFVAPGSVYYFQSTEGQPLHWPLGKSFTQTPVDFIDGDCGSAGFGQVIAFSW
jgi:CRISPR-associated protein Cmr3